MTDFSTESILIENHIKYCSKDCNFREIWKKPKGQCYRTDLEEIAEKRNTENQREDQRHAEKRQEEKRRSAQNTEETTRTKEQGEQQQ